MEQNAKQLALDAIAKAELFTHQNRIKHAICALEAAVNLLELLEEKLPKTANEPSAKGNEQK